MIKHSTWWLAFLLLVGGLLYGLLGRRLPTTEQRQLRDAFVWRLVSDQVVSLAIEYRDFKVECERRRDGWFLTAPISGRADAARIGQILNALEDLPRIETVTADDRRRRNTSFDTYALGTPRGRVVVEYGGRREELWIGAVAPVGEWLYVRLAGQEKVFVTVTNLLGVLPQSVAELRERRFLYRDPRQAARIEIHRPQGFVRLIRRNARWMMQQPVSAPADEERVDGLLEVLSGLTIESFVGDFRADPVAYQLSLDDAVAQVGLWWSNGEEAGARLFFGKPVENRSGLIYARRGDADAICMVSAAVLEGLQVKATELRDRALFTIGVDDVARLGVRHGEHQTVLERATPTSRWMVAEPVRAPADDAFVRKLVAQLSGLRAEAFADLSTQVARPFAGDAAPLTIELGGRIALAATGSVTGLGGVAPPSVSSDAGEVRTGESNWVIRFDLGLWEGPPRQVCAVPEKDRMAALLDPSVFSPDTPPAHPGFPIPVRAVDYRDRTVMTLDAATVRRISRSGEAVDASQPAIESGTDGVWRVVGDVSRSVDPARVREVLDAVGGLKAARFLGDQPGDERRFGLDPPRHRITFTHGDPETGLIQNSVLLGDPVAGDGVAAMVQGRDLIFILEPDTAARLCRPWVE